MTSRQACAILGVTDNDSPITIKRKYHALLHLYHPDSGSGDKLATQRIVEAFRVLRDSPMAVKHADTALPAINPAAYCERTLFARHSLFADDPADIYVRGRGMFFWDPDQEEFTLFCRSVLLEAKKLSPKEHLKRTFHLLIQDFIKPLDCLKKICSKAAEHQYVLAGRSEHTLTQVTQCSLKGTRLYAGEEQLSFDDDSFYYILAMLIARDAAHITAAPDGRSKVRITVRITDEAKADKPGNSSVLLRTQTFSG